MTLPAEEFRGSDRFVVERRLGSGAFGVVYQAFDRERGIPVAVKALRKPGAEDLLRFKWEFRALADIAHPNLVTLHELLTEGGQWFFTMELVEGVSFLEYVRGGTLADAPTVDTTEAPTTLRGDQTESAPSSGSDPSAETLGAPRETPMRLDLGLLRSALRQLAEGLGALHDAGRLHRDLKPSNVLVTDEGRVVILDFGLVADLADAIPLEARVAGTPAYMSPEQGEGLPVTEASDWYAVGVMLYEALTGRVPFAGTFQEVLRQKRRADPTPARSLALDVPEDLDALCRDLLERDPRARPRGREVLPRLGAAERRARPRRAAPFVGRERELLALREAFTAARAGRAVAVAVQGASGMGKSALVRHFLKEIEARERDAVILAGRCYEQESVPYKAVDSLMDAASQYLGRLAAGDVERLLPADVGALARLFPVLRRVEAVAAAPRRADIPDPLELRARAFAALRDMAARVARERPLVLFIDDLQWGDADSAALLAGLLGPPDPPPLLLLLAYRSEDASHALLASLRASLAAGAELRDVLLGELDARDSRDLARALAEDAGAGLDPEAIAREAGGSPFFIGELARYTGRPEERVTLERVVRARVARLPDAARRLLEVVAVAGRPVELEAARRAAELSDGFPAALALLRGERLVRTREGRDRHEVETSHDRIRATVVERIALGALRAHHLRLAVALEVSGRADPETLALHFQAAGDAARAAEHAAAAAARAASALAFDRAARLYRMALDLGAPEADLRTKLGDALASAGRGPEAAEAYLAAASRAVAGDRLELERRAAEQLLISGHVPEGLAVLRGVLAEMGMSLAETPRAALLSLLSRRLQIRVRGLSFRERHPTQIAGEELVRVDTCWSVAVGLGLVDTIRGADFQTRHLLLALRAGEPYRVARALAMEAAYSATGGGRTERRTRRLLERARTLAGRLGHPHATALVTLVSGIDAYCRGRWREARRASDEAGGLLREHCAGVAWERDSAQLFALVSLFFLGEVREMSARLPAALKDAEARGDIWAETNLRTRCSYLAHLAADDVEAARQDVSQALARWPGEGFHLQHWFALFAGVGIDLYADEDGAAWELVRGRWAALERSLILRVQVLRILSHHFRARSALAAVAHAAQPEALLRVAEDGAARIEAERMGWGYGLARTLRAGVAATRGRGNEALTLAARAEAELEAADMPLHAATARRRRGELLEGVAGRTLVKAADAWMASRGIRDPRRMTAMLAPGRWTG